MDVVLIVLIMLVAVFLVPWAVRKSEEADAEARAVLCPPAVDTAVDNDGWLVKHADTWFEWLTREQRLALNRLSAQELDLNPHRPPSERVVAFEYPVDPPAPAPTHGVLLLPSGMQTCECQVGEATVLRVRRRDVDRVRRVQTSNRSWQPPRVQPGPGPGGRRPPPPPGPGAASPLNPMWALGSAEMTRELTRQAAEIERTVRQLLPQARIRP